MSAVPMAITAQDVAKGLSMFEIDESLEALVEEAEQEAESNNGEISLGTKTALATYAEAFGYKVVRRQLLLPVDDNYFSRSTTTTFLSGR